MLRGAVAPCDALPGALRIVLSLRVSPARAIGDLAEWVSRLLLLRVMAEAAGAPQAALHADGAAPVIGRILPPRQLDGRLFTPLRVPGGGRSLCPIAVAAVHLPRSGAAI